jgi:hypothetical protein
MCKEMLSNLWRLSSNISLEPYNSPIGKLMKWKINFEKWQQNQRLVIWRLFYIHSLENRKKNIFASFTYLISIIFKTTKGRPRQFAEIFVQVKNKSDIRIQTEFLTKRISCHGHYSLWRGGQFFCQMTTLKSVQAAGALHRIRISRNDAKFFSSNENKNKKTTKRFITNRQNWRWTCLVIARPKRTTNFGG